MAKRSGKSTNTNVTIRGSTNVRVSVGGAKEEPELIFPHRLVIGDWSNDGHGAKEFVDFLCTHSEKAIKKAYFAAIKKGGVSLHDDHKGTVKHVVCCDCDDSTLTKEARDALIALGIDMSKIGHDQDDGGGGFYLSYDDIAVLFMEMVKTQIADFDYQQTKTKALNGYWSEDFNIGFGYGTLGQG